jgi:hypothetical protein
VPPPDELQSDAEKGLWHTIQNNADVLEAAADDLVPQVVHLAPQDARAAPLHAAPGHFALRIWSPTACGSNICDQRTTRTVTSSREASKGPANQSYHATKAWLIQEERSGKVYRMARLPTKARHKRSACRSSWARQSLAQTNAALCTWTWPSTHSQDMMRITRKT